MKSTVLSGVNLGNAAVILVASVGCKRAQKTPEYSGKQVSLRLYNLENLFDTIDNPDKTDNQFLLGAAAKWNSTRYFDKLEKIGWVIAQLDGSHPIAMGSCE